jgi:hypothetical protein
MPEAYTDSVMSSFIGLVFSLLCWQAASINGSRRIEKRIVFILVYKNKYWAQMPGGISPEYPFFTG